MIVHKCENAPKSDIMVTNNSDFFISSHSVGGSRICCFPEGAK